MIVYFLFLSLLSHASEKAETKTKNDLVLDLGYYEISKQAKGKLKDVCPMGTLELKKDGSQYQLWIGERFNLTAINEDEVRYDYEGDERCYSRVKVETKKLSVQDSQIVETVKKFCKLSEEDKEFVKKYDTVTTVKFMKDKIDFKYDLTELKDGREKKESTSCTLKKEKDPSASSTNPDYKPKSN